MTKKEKLNKKLQKIAKEWIAGSFDLQKKVFEKDKRTKDILKKVIQLSSF